MKRKKIFVALSGGVDSAAAAALLKDCGFDVSGVFIKIWQPEFTECTWREDRLDAMRVAAALEIPFFEVDLSDIYKRQVVDDMLQNYAQGVTPNPDVLCNRVIKFGALWNFVKEHGGELIATGHHARVERKNGKFTLTRGSDAAKDQSYFLWQLTQDDLEHTLLPVGDYTKDEIRNIAERRGLPVAQKRDSQGLCFVGDIHMHDFLKTFLDVKEGNVLDTAGDVVGTHDGAVLYTVGQRHGFAVTKMHDKAPLYVINTDVEKNTVTVSNSLEGKIKKEVEIARTNWITERPAEGKEYTAQVRYRAHPQVCEYKQKDKIVFQKPQLAAPGQSLVLYSNKECLGGGIIT